MMADDEIGINAIESVISCGGGSSCSCFDRDECSRLTSLLEEKTKALELLICENQDLRIQLEDMRAKANNAEAENKTLIDRWNLQKVKDSDRLNEVHLHVTITVVLMSANMFWSVEGSSGYPFDKKFFLE